MLIYKITNDVNDKIYIGKTTKSLEERIKGHRRALKHGVDYHLYRAMRKYGWEKFHFSVIEECDDIDTLNELESKYIAQFNTIEAGYNMVPGGESNAMDSAFVKEKHDATMRSEEVRKKISASLKATIQRNGGMSEEHRRHLSENKKAFYASERGQIAKQRHKETFHLSESHYRALNDAKNKALYCINSSGEIVAEFSRVTDAAIWWQNNGYDKVRYLRTISSAIKRSATSDRYIKGLKWIYRV